MWVLSDVWIPDGCLELDVSMCVQIKKPLKPYQEEHVKEQKKLGRVCDMTEEEPRRTRAPKAVDEDLYKIPPELLHEKPKRVGGPTTLLFSSLLFFSFHMKILIF